METMLTTSAPPVELSYNGPVMTLKAKGITETYKLGVAPKSTDSLVLFYRSHALQQLSLDNLSKDLMRSADLMFLAYNGVAGSGELAADVSKRQKRFGDLCTECVSTMMVFRDKSRDILSNICEAFTLLIAKDEADESYALEVLADCSANAMEMSKKCAALAAGFETLAKETSEDCSKAEIAIGKQQAKIAEIKKLKEEMQATLLKQQKLAKELQITIDQLNSDIAEAKAEEETESKRAFALALTGAFTNMVGTAASAVVAIKTDPMGVRGMMASQKELKAENDPAVKAANEKLQEAEKKQTEAKAQQETAEKKKTEAEAKKKAIEEKIEAAKKAKEEKETKANDKETEADEKKKLLDEVEQLNTEIKAHKEAIKAIDDEITNAEGEISTALKAVGGIAEGLKAAREDFNKMSATAEKRYESAKALRLTLLSQKRQDETAKRDALGQIEEMTEKLKSQNTEQELEVATRVALEMAKWAFDNIYKALNQAKFFWDNMAKFCENLVDSKLGKDIKRRGEKLKREEKIAYFQTEGFLKPAIMYMANWKAMEVVCSEYVQKSQDVRGKVMQNIAKSPTIEEARRDLAALKAKIIAELKEDEAVAEDHIKEIKELEAQFENF